MIGMHLTHKQSGVSGVVDAVAAHADGKALARIDDHWFFADDLA